MLMLSFLTDLIQLQWRKFVELMIGWLERDTYFIGGQVNGEQMTLLKLITSVKSMVSQNQLQNSPNTISIKGTRLK